MKVGRRASAPLASRRRTPPFWLSGNPTLTPTIRTLDGLDVRLAGLRAPISSSEQSSKPRRKRVLIEQMASLVQTGHIQNP
jgi:hypothetical protein